MGGRINTIMQTCFFAISGVLPRDEAIEAIKYAIKKTYGKRGEAVVQKNFAAVDATLEPPARSEGSDGGRQHVRRASGGSGGRRRSSCRRCWRRSSPGDGDYLPVSAMPIDGTFPTGTAQWEKRNIALEIPEWDEQLCIQCGKCVLVCPHAVIRAKVYDSRRYWKARPRRSSRRPRKWKDFKEPEVHAAGGAGRLHRLRTLRRGLPGEEQDRSEAQGHQHGRAAGDARARGTRTGTSS